MFPYRLISIGILGAGCTFASAQTTTPNYPVRPIRFIVPYPAGAAADLQARAITQRVTETIGQQVIVDNRVGANGNIAMEVTAKSSPDGYTVVYALTAQYVINPYLYPKIPYDPVKDFAPIALMNRGPFVLFENPSVPATSIKQLIDLAKAEPGKMSFASSGNGASGHLSMELLKKMAGIDLVHIPYKGAAPSLLDLLAGRVQVSFLTWGTGGQYAKNGKLRALGVTTEKRVPALPDIPAISETVPGYDMSVWYGLSAAAGTSKAIIKRLNTEFVRALASPEVKRQFERDMIEPLGSTPEQFAEFLRNESVKWAKLVKDSGAKLD